MCGKANFGSKGRFARQVLLKKHCVRWSGFFLSLLGSVPVVLSRLKKSGVGIGLEGRGYFLIEDNENFFPA